MRRRFGEVITKLADEDDDIFVIVADIGQEFLMIFVINIQIDS